jgi:peptidyl-tRNA hydrolase, PTH1 family
MILIVGLGNPGERYEGTRHNIGFGVVDRLLRDLKRGPVDFKEEKKFFSLLSKIDDLILLKPTTYMNESGKAVRTVMDFYQITPEQIYIIHDDLDLPIGKLRIRENGASGGHKGVQSILTAVGSEACPRFRLGIGKGHDMNETGEDRNIHRRNIISHVLSRFTTSEAGKLKVLIKKTSEAVQYTLSHGIEAAMNKYN